MYRPHYILLNGWFLEYFFDNWFIGLTMYLSKIPVFQGHYAPLLSV